MSRLFTVFVALCILGLALAQPNPCVTSGAQLLSNCQAELAEVQKIYPLGSTTPITPDQVTQILNVAKSMNLPTPRCCTVAKTFDQGKCACDTSLPPLLSQVGLQVTPTGLQSASVFTGQACSYTPVPCS